jgi:AbiV family abortive infection protein
MADALPPLTPQQVVQLQDELLANADRLLNSALTVLDLGNVGLARSLAILGLEESGKAIAIHRRRVEIAYEDEGAAFTNEWLQKLWLSHSAKLKLVHDFLVEEEYWFDVEPPDPDENAALLGEINEWAREHNKLKQRGFYVDVDAAQGVFTPDDVGDEESLRLVISHVHQIGWQLRLGEHIVAKRQEQMASLADLDSGAAFHLKNDAYRLHLPSPGANPFAHLGRRGHEAETRELLRLAEEQAHPDGGGQSSTPYE